jgi:hypothetical protein
LSHCGSLIFHTQRATRAVFVRIALRMIDLPQYKLELRIRSLDGDSTFVTRGSVSSEPYPTRTHTYGSYWAVRSELAAAGVRLSAAEVSHLLNNRKLVIETSQRTLQLLGLWEPTHALAA